MASRWSGHDDVHMISDDNEDLTVCGKSVYEVAEATDGSREITCPKCLDKM